MVGSIKFAMNDKNGDAINRGIVQLSDVGTCIGCAAHVTLKYLIYRSGEYFGKSE